MSLMIQFCSSDNYIDVQELIDKTINEDITYQSQPLDLRNQRTYAVRVSCCPIASQESLADLDSLSSPE